MLVIRMQRTGRKGHAQFRVVVQDSRRTPSSGRVVAQLGHFDPHTKVAVLDKDRAVYYLKNGAQPSDRVARLLKAEGVKLPGWVKLNSAKKRSIKNPEKLRKNQPKETSDAAEMTKKPTEVMQDDHTSDKTGSKTESPKEGVQEATESEDSKTESADEPKEQ